MIDKVDWLLPGVCVVLQNQMPYPGVSNDNASGISHKKSEVMGIRAAL